jgi:tetratricopeptide (TPR) repeat protein
LHRFGVSTLVRTRLTILIIFLITSGCGRRTSAALLTTAVPEPESLYSQGLADFHQGTPESYMKAAAAFRSAWRLKPDRCDYALNLAQSLLFLSTEQIVNLEEYEPRQSEALAVVDAAEPMCISSYQPFVLRLRALIAGRGPAATDLINHAVDIDPNDAMNWVVLAYLDPTSARLVTGQGSGRWVAMERAVELKPDSALIQYELGKNYSAVREKETAATQAFDRATEHNPRHFRAYLGLAYSAAEGVDVEPLYRKVVELAPNFLEGRIALGSYYASLDDTDQAVEQYSAALATKPGYDTAHFHLALLMLQVDRPQEAEQHFLKVLELNPGVYEARYYLGNIFYGRKDLAKAKAEYEQALNIRANYPEAVYGLGHVYRQQNQPDLALAEFDKVIRMQPRFGDAYLSRGDIRAERRQFADAMADYQKAIESYEAQLVNLNASIAYAEGHRQSRILQAEKKRNEREKTRVQTLLESARRYKSEMDDSQRQR